MVIFTTNGKPPGRRPIGAHRASRRSSLARSIRRNHLARNSIFVITNTAATGLFGFIYWGIAARSYTTHVIGVATALVAAMNLMCLIGTLGIGQTLLQRLPRANDSEWSRLVNCTVFAGSGGGLIAGALGVLILPEISNQFDLVRKPDIASLVVVGTSVLTTTNLLDYVFIAQRAAHHVLSRSLLLSIGKLVLLVAIPIVFASHGVAAIVASWVAGAAISSVATLTILIPRLGRPHRWTPRGIIREMRRLARYLMLNHIISLSAVLIPTIMPLLVVARLSAAENAYFYMAWLVASLVLTVSAAVSGTLLTEGSYDPDKLFDKVRQSVVMISMLLIAPALVLTLAGRPLLGLFGSEYSTHAYVPLLLFLVVVVPDAITNIYITVLRVRGQHHIGAIVNIVMSVVTLGLAWLLLPRIGITAAGWSWAAGQFVGVGIMIVMTSGTTVRWRTLLRGIR
jgi:O-antigen/teichoic acid export membrane protein